jgi:hypothetical protein
MVKCSLGEVITTPQLCDQTEIPVGGLCGMRKMVRRVPFAW